MKEQITNNLIPGTIDTPESAKIYAEILKDIWERVLGEESVNDKGEIID